MTEQRKPHVSDAQIAANLMDYETSSRKAFLDSYTDLPDVIKAVVHAGCLSTCHNHPNADHVFSGYRNVISGTLEFGDVSPAEHPAFRVGYFSVNRPSQVVALEEATEEVWEFNKFMALNFYKLHPDLPKQFGKSVEFSQPLADMTIDQLLMSHLLCYEEVFSLLVYLGIGVSHHLTDSGYTITHVQITKDPFHFQHISPELKQEALEEDEELEDQTGVITIGVTNPHAEFPFITLTWDMAVLIRDNQAWDVYADSPQAKIDEEKYKDQKGTVSLSEAAPEEFEPRKLLEVNAQLQNVQKFREGFLPILWPEEETTGVKSEDVAFDLVFSAIGVGVIEIEWTRPMGVEKRFALLGNYGDAGFDVIDVTQLTAQEVQTYIQAIAKAGSEYDLLSKVFKITVMQVMAIVMKKDLP